MFQFFKRVKTYVGSELNAALDKAEDPVKMLDQFMREMAADIRDAETAVAKQIANEKMLKKKLNDAESMAAKRQQQAVDALEAGNEDLARRALEDKKVHEGQADSFRGAHKQAEQDAAALREKLDEMKREYQEMQLKKDSLKARAESAKTRTKMNRAMSSVGGDESRRGFERMEEKVLQYEAEAETSDDLRSSSRSIDDELDALKKNSDIDEELAELKKKLGKE
ncbi:PspA/IM30 family protein [Bacillus thermotolerans]|uniref:Phage shock protein A n=1 Tax=Bacillus thermotolerans TaxID=1221996 RepID=A0A0F5I2A7_BACTR|nr:PspA/IM30 family protein [Bacillus thermotolerans]KKB38247.1 Phage shock protein A [Bacillus thermotolerans]KKB39794.1 Phage shock protein A [Bacillus thermotolerans]KKB44228.1 Phage shock protein A [Bacillus thermotolerans]